MTIATRHSTTSPVPDPTRSEVDVVRLADGDHYRHLHFDRSARVWVDPFAATGATVTRELRRSA